MSDIKEKFWAYMDGAKGFWTLIALTILSGIGYLIGARKLIDTMIGKKTRRNNP
jgi:hypothetical protein